MRVGVRRWSSGAVIPFIAVMFGATAACGKPSAAQSSDAAMRVRARRCVRGVDTYRDRPGAREARARPERCVDWVFALGAGFAIPSDMLLLLLLLLFLAIVGGGFGYSRFGYGGFSPAAIVVVILVLLALTGRL